MKYLSEAQTLANKYRTAIKQIRLIQKDTDLVPVIVPDDKPVPVSQLIISTQGTFRAEFEGYTERYRDILKEVRVIFKDGVGASQFFPAGTSERVVWDSVIPKEELTG